MMGPSVLCAKLLVRLLDVLDLIQPAIYAMIYYVAFALTIRQSAELVRLMPVFHLIYVLVTQGMAMILPLKLVKVVLLGVVHVQQITK